jgi:hypothetical protein
MPDQETSRFAVTIQVRGPNARLWELFNKEGPLTAEEQAYMDAIEAAYDDEEAGDVDL